MNNKKFSVEAINNGNLYFMDAKTNYVVSEVICIGCKHRFISTRPEDTLLSMLECSGCGEVGFTIETGQVIDDDN